MTVIVGVVGQGFVVSVGCQRMNGGLRLRLAAVPSFQVTSGKARRCDNAVVNDLAHGQCHAKDCMLSMVSAGVIAQARQRGHPQVPFARAGR
jgi:hypothetical protein